jgi:endonuclease-8
VPEGDTIFRAARTLNRALAGRTVTRFESVYPALMRIDHDTPLVGRTIESVSSRGKHLLMFFSGNLVLHTHMRMNGVWHVYRRGERWRKPRRDMRIAIETDRAVAVGFNIPVAELLTEAALAAHPRLRALGPDLTDAAFDAAEARRRLRARGADAIGDALLDQRALAGIGNVFKSEILFLASIDPFCRVRDLADAELERIVDIARTQLTINVAPRARTLAPTRGRRTTGSLHPDRGLWVYGRGGLPCRRCGSRILARKTGESARLTYWCPACQPAAEPDPQATNRQ